jgi:hypothetical protein
MQTDAKLLIVRSFYAVFAYNALQSYLSGSRFTWPVQSGLQSTPPPLYENVTQLQTNKNNVFLCASHYYKQPFSCLHLEGGGPLRARVLKPCFLLPDPQSQEVHLAQHVTSLALRLVAPASLPSCLCGCPRNWCSNGRASVTALHGRNAWVNFKTNQTLLDLAFGNGEIKLAANITTFQNCDKIVRMTRISSLGFPYQPFGVRLI